jgi:hypothetical protein
MIKIRNIEVDIDKNFQGYKKILLKNFNPKESLILSTIIIIILMKYNIDIYQNVLS